MLEEADDDTSINDPVYSPAPIAVSTFASQQDSRLSRDNSEGGHAEVVRLSNDSGLANPRENGLIKRASSGTTTASTVNEYYEADEARTDEH